ATLAALKKLGNDPLIRTREVKLAARRGDRTTALEVLREVLRMPAESNWPIDTSIQALTAAGWSAGTETALAEVLDEANARPLVARHWVSLSTTAANCD